MVPALWPAKQQRVTDASFLAFAEEMSAKLPAVVGAAMFLPHRVVRRGERSLRYDVAGNSYQVSVGSFFQVNRYLLPELVELVTKESRGGLAWDLYAGVGLFACKLAAKNVTAVESDGFSGDDLVTNLSGTHRVVRSETLKFLTAARERPELVVVDPPRAGLGKEVCTQLGRVGAGQIIYVSCDPATLARDLQLLLRNGYEIASMHLVDLFPQTFHMETVTSLKRN